MSNHSNHQPWWWWAQPIILFTPVNSECVHCLHSWACKTRVKPVQLSIIIISKLICGMWTPQGIYEPKGPEDSTRLHSTYTPQQSLTILFASVAVDYPPVFSYYTAACVQWTPVPKHCHQFPSCRTLGCFSWQPTTLCNMQANLHCIPPIASYTHI